MPLLDPLGSFTFEKEKVPIRLIDEVRIWKIARSGEEIAAAMRQRLKGDESGLIGDWRFDEGEGTHATADCKCGPAGGGGAGRVAKPVR